MIILTGADPAFCAGLDLKELGSTGGNLGPGGGSDGPPARSGAAARSPRSTKPLIGAINGVAITGGFELALNCDFLVASSELAKFGDTHTRVGVMPGWGLTVLLPQAIGVRRAREMSFTGNFLTRRRGAPAAGLGQPRRAARRADPVRPAIATDIIGNDQPGRAPDPPDLRRDHRRRRRLGDRGPATRAAWRRSSGRVRSTIAARRRRHPGTRPRVGDRGSVSGAPGSEIGLDRLGDVEGEDLGAGLVEVEAVVGADLLELVVAGPCTYSAKPRLRPENRFHVSMNTTFGRLAASAMTTSFCTCMRAVTSGLSSLGMPTQISGAVVATEVVHRGADPLAVLGAPIGVVASRSGSVLDRPRLVEVAQTLRVVAPKVTMTMSGLTAGIDCREVCAPVEEVGAG